MSYYRERTRRGQHLIVCSVSLDLCGDFIIAKINTHFRYRCMKYYNIIRLREDIKNRCSRVRPIPKTDIPMRACSATSYKLACTSFSVLISIIPSSFNLRLILVLHFCVLPFVFFFFNFSVVARIGAPLVILPVALTLPLFLDSPHFIAGYISPMS